MLDTEELEESQTATERNKAERQKNYTPYSVSADNFVIYVEIQSYSANIGTALADGISAWVWHGC